MLCTFTRKKKHVYIPFPICIKNVLEKKAIHQGLFWTKTKESGLETSCTVLRSALHWSGRKFCVSSVRVEKTLCGKEALLKLTKLSHNSCTVGRNCCRKLLIYLRKRFTKKIYLELSFSAGGGANTVIQIGLLANFVASMNELKRKGNGIVWNFFEFFGNFFENFWKFFEILGDFWKFFWNFRKFLENFWALFRNHLGLFGITWIFWNFLEFFGISWNFYVGIFGKV